MTRPHLGKLSLKHINTNLGTRQDFVGSVMSDIKETIIILESRYIDNNKTEKRILLRTENPLLDLLW